MAINKLNAVQLKAMEYVVSKAKPQSEAAYPKLLIRVLGFKYSEANLKETLRYVRDVAPLIIHLDLTNVMPFLLKDTHYRNQFETNTSRGTLSHVTRRGWESRLFGGNYDGPAVTGFDRCKYGVLNITNDPAGVTICHYYGDSYLVLKHVRLRASFADKDTGYDGVTLSCCEYYAHIMNTFTDLELKAVMEVALAIRRNPFEFRRSETLYQTFYKEIQIHGPVALNENFSKLIVNVRHRSESHMMKSVAEFCAKNGIVHGFTDGTGPAFDPDHEVNAHFKSREYLDPDEAIKEDLKKPKKREL
jgi:hypothetical protein